MKNTKCKLYIAYGSNLNMEQMALRCPTAKVMGASVLEGWRLLFRGSPTNAVATVERINGGTVPILVWKIMPEDEAALDAYEGWPQLYRKETLLVTLNGKLNRAMIYIMNDGQPGRPGDDYYQVILDGYQSAGFDEEVLKKAVLDSAPEDRENAEIRRQITAIRDTGETNMFDTRTVQRIAFREDFYELVSFIEDNRSEYAHFIMTGEFGGGKQK